MSPLAGILYTLIFRRKARRQDARNLVFFTLCSLEKLPIFSVLHPRLFVVFVLDAKLKMWA
jgi:hypothetical protein